MTSLIGVIVSFPRLNSLITDFSMVSKRQKTTSTSLPSIRLLFLENVPKKNNVFAINGICM